VFRRAYAVCVYSIYLLGRGYLSGGKKDAVELLIDSGAEVNVKNNEGKTPLDNASKLGYKDIAELLKTKGAKGETTMRKRPKKIIAAQYKQEALEGPIKFTILYDNYRYAEDTKPDWGFSCLIEGTEKTILFDTGTNPDILFHNVEQLNVDLQKVEQIVISHNHFDHTGGLLTVLERNPDVSVYLPVSFPYEFIRDVEAKKAEVTSVYEPEEISANVFSTGEMGEAIKEQSLILNTKKGLIIVTGCSHQGIVEIIKHADKLFDKPIYLVFGGFHLGGKPAAELQEIITSFKEIGVEKCGATHCTGDQAIEMFKKAYGKDYIPMGTGRILELEKEKGIK